MTVEQASFYISGGTLPTDAPSYVEREADRELLSRLQSGEYCYVLTSRQMGKSSLMVRTVRKLEQTGVLCAVLDLAGLGQTNVTAEQWYFGLLRKLGRSSSVGRLPGLAKALQDFWQSHQGLSPVQRWIGAIEDVLLAQTEQPIVLFVDEVDSVLSLPFSTDELFAAIRDCFNRRAQDPPFSRLTFCILGVASPSDLIRDVNTTPFNIGRRIQLNDFIQDEAVPLAQGLERVGRSRRLLERVLYWTGGQPYLTQALCQAVVEAQEVQTIADVDRLCEQMYLSKRAQETSDHLKTLEERVLRSSANVVRLLEFYGRICRRERIPDTAGDSLVSVLKLSGIVRAEDGFLLVRNRIYERVFDKAWVNENLPDAEWKRIQQAYRRRLVRVISFSTTLILVMAGLTTFAFRQRNEVNGLAYVTNMNIIPVVWKNKDFVRMKDLLDKTREYKDRGFEWGYWHHVIRLELLTLKGHNCPVTSVGISADGNQMVTASDDGRARLWDARKEGIVLTLPNEVGFVTAIAIQPDGKRIFTGDNEGKIRVCDSRDGRILRTIQGHASAVNSIATSSDGTRIVTGGDDGDAMVWNADTGSNLLALQAHDGGMTSVTIYPNGKRIVTGSLGGTVTVWDAGTGKIVLGFEGHRSPVISIAMPLNGQSIVTCGEDGTVNKWFVHEETNPKTAECTLRLDTPRLQPLEEPNNKVMAATILPDGKYIITGSKDGTVSIWDANDPRKELLTFERHTGSVTHVAVSADGRRILTGSEDSTAMLWNTALTCDMLNSMANGYSVDFIALFQDAKHLLTENGDGSRKVWDVETGKIAKGHGNDIATRWSLEGKKESWVIEWRDGNVISMSPSQDHRVKAHEAEVEKTFQALKKRDPSVTCAAMFPDGWRMVTGSDNGTVKVWDTMTGWELLTLTRHNSAVTCVAISTDGKRLITGSQDGTVLGWQAD